MRYEGHETINLPESITQQDVFERINSWLATENGSHYKVQKSDSKGLRLKRGWIDNFWKTLFMLGILFPLLTLIISAFEGNFVYFINQAVYILSPLLFVSVAALIFESRVLIDINVQNSVINLKLQSTNKVEAENDFDSIITAIR